MTDATRALPRSILYTPALSLDRVVKAWSYDADVHLIDLEDAVPPPGRPAAREVCRRALGKAPVPANTAVRINPLGTLDAVRDLLMLAESPVRPGIVVMTMVDSSVEVRLLRDTLATAGAHPEIYVTLETPAGVRAVDGIAEAADGLILGSADLAATLGVEITWAGLLAVRQAMALACARYGTACVDTANFRLDAPEVLAEEIERVRELGFHGKVAVHPSELAAINRALRPDMAELRRARRVTEAVRAADGGVALLDGAMVGPPFARRARMTVERGDAWHARFAPTGARTAGPRAAAPETVPRGTADPGATDPGATDPGATDPGATDPGATDTGPGHVGAAGAGAAGAGTGAAGSAGPRVSDSEAAR
ncbi:HpcH/HpaI aldolase/citrate lyase family protein [Streptomyces malaysiense]|uniref:HpcH/HpaI aldolase/citrate lyase family protein n=1 Tax=Streptomyces malaysiense TaxID=1428626 RepID=UPI001F0A9C78|nr:CoA ester lyase [Streptomyces malaysiense]